MKRPRVSFGAGVLWTCALFFQGQAGGADERFFDQTLGDFREELRLAGESGKRGVLLFFQMDDCPFCRRMEAREFTQPQVIEYFRQNFLCFSVDIEGDVEVVDFQGRQRTEREFAFQGNRVRATPVIQFYDLEGRVVARYTGATSSVAEFLLLGEYVVENVYREMSFIRYKRLQRHHTRQ